MESKRIKVNIENLFLILKDSLYISTDVFLRELVANALDAITKRRELSPVFEDQVTIQILPEEAILKISDSGIGMTNRELEEYLGIIAASGAEEFIKSFKEVKEPELIGKFGIGFYSVFMVAKQVTVTSRKYETNKVFSWFSDNGLDYKIHEVREDRGYGTTVEIKLREEFYNYLEEEHLIKLIRKWANYVSCPILLNNQVVNTGRAIWKINPAELSDQDIKDSASEIFGTDNIQSPLFWFIINVDYPITARGLFMVTERNSSEKGNVVFFQNGMFVDDNCRDLLPDIAPFLWGMIESPDLPTNVTRDTFRRRKEVTTIRQVIKKNFLQKAKNLKDSQPSTFKRFNSLFGREMKALALMEKVDFRSIEPLVGYYTIENRFKTIEEIIKEASKSQDKVVCYCSDLSKQQFHIQKLEKKGKLILIMPDPIDIPMRETIMHIHPDINIVRVDADPSSNTSGADNSRNLKEDPANQALIYFMRDNFSEISSVKLVCEDPASPPAWLKISEVESRFEEVKSVLELNGLDKLLKDFKKGTVMYINVNSPIVGKISSYLEANEKQKASEIANSVMILAKAYSGKSSPQLIREMTNLIDTLVRRVFNIN